MSVFRRDKDKKDAETSQLVPFFQLFRFATKFDIFLMILGTIGSLGNGSTLPLMLIVFMNIFDSFTDSIKLCGITTLSANSSNTSINISTTTIDYGSLLSDLTNKMSGQALYLVYLGIATHILSYIQVTMWLISSQRQTMLIRKRLFQSILKQDVGWFDVYKTGTLNNRLTEYFLTNYNIFN